MSQSILLYHGTCSKGADNIQCIGLNEHTCLTSDLEVAEYYAECAHDESGEEPVVLTVLVPRHQLKVDFPAFEEPLSFYRNDHTRSDSEWHEMIEDGRIPFPDDEHDVDTALEITKSVRTSGHIPISSIDIHK